MRTFGSHVPCLALVANKPPSRVEWPPAVPIGLGRLSLPPTPGPEKPPASALAQRGAATHQEQRLQKPGSAQAGAAAGAYGPSFLM